MLQRDELQEGPDGRSNEAIVLYNHTLKKQMNKHFDLKKVENKRKAGTCPIACMCFGFLSAGWIISRQKLFFDTTTYTSSVQLQTQNNYKANDDLLTYWFISMRKKQPGAPDMTDAAEQFATNEPSVHCLLKEGQSERLKNVPCINERCCC